MNREIEFRGMRLDNYKWLYGDLVHDNYGGCHVCPFDSTGLSIENKVNPHTVGQFTGLVDKKCNKIYEEDVLSVGFADGSERRYFVGWNNKTLSWGVMPVDSYANYMCRGSVKFNNRSLRAFLKNAAICEVVGNIYDL